MKTDNIVLIALYDADSLAIRTLHAVLKANHFNVTSFFFKHPKPDNTIDPASDDDIEALINSVIELQPVLVGISVRSTLFNFASQLTQKIKDRLDTLVLWGGIHPTIRPEQSIQATDMVCVGEGEETIVELATRLSRGEEIDNIQNLWLRKDDEVVKNDLRAPIQDLDSVPFPEFSGENKYFIHNGQSHGPWFQEDRPVYPIMTTKGCLFHCAYCCSPLVRKMYKGKGKYIRRRSVAGVIEELVQAKTLFKQLRLIQFWDDIFTFDIKWMREFCRQYKEAVNIPFFCYYHPKVLTEELVLLLKDAGVEFMGAGIQTASEEINRKYYKRPVENRSILKAARILQKHEVDSFYDLILDNPMETEKDRRETLNLLLKLPRPFQIHHATLTHFPETGLTKVLLEEKVISASDVEDQKQKGYERWSKILDLKRDNEYLFWENLYFLANKRYVPKWFVNMLSHMGPLRKYPAVLTLLLRWLSPHLHTGIRSNILRKVETEQIEG